MALQKVRKMRILYGVVGEGMGHATRSRVVLEHLLTKGHELHVVVSGRAHDFIQSVFKDDDRVDITEIVGLHLVQDVDGIDRSASLWSNVGQAPESLRHNLRMYKDVAGRFSADVVISDFESWAYFYARAHDIPVISIDNIQVLHRCAHADEIQGTRSVNFLIARYSAKVKMPGAYHFLVTSFFFPPVRKPRTTLVPPILRPEILAATRTGGDHVLVYHHKEAIEALLPTLRKLTQYPFRVYGWGEDAVEGHIRFRPFSQTGFVDDLASAKGAIAGGGFSLMSECVHLKVPLLSVPLQDQFEQELNARYLQRNNYGEWVPELTPEAVTGFLSRLPEHAAALEGYTSQDNSMTLECVDELLRRVALGEPPPDTIDAPSMGDVVSSDISDAIGD